MRFRPGAACAVVAFGILLPSEAAAQSTDAFVLPFGMLRLEVEGRQATFDSRFDASGERVRLGAELSGDLIPERLAALRPLATQLSDFLAATSEAPGADPTAGDPNSISLGLLSAAATGGRTEARARLSIGLLPRVELGASLPIGRSERLLQRFDLVDGNLGVNPDRTGNAALLASIGWAPLGNSVLLPTAASPLGTEIQTRVTALTGESLTLPTVPASGNALQSILEEEYGLAAVASRVEQWRLGDLEVETRGLLLSTFGSAPVPAQPSGMHLRVGLLAGARLPTGTEPDSLHLLGSPPAERLSALYAGGAGDLFVGTRLWLTGALRVTWNREATVSRRIAPRDAPLSTMTGPTTVTIAPGNGLELRVAPRFRLNEAIALGGEYAFIGVGDTRYSGGPAGADVSVLDLAGGALHRVGFGIRYSSLPAYFDRRASLPAEVTLGYQRTLSGPEGAPAGGMVTVTAGVLPRLW